MTVRAIAVPSPSVSEVLAAVARAVWFLRHELRPSGDAVAADDVACPYRTARARLANHKKTTLP